jgi:hypothetical protein
MLVDSGNTRRGRRPVTGPDTGPTPPDQPSRLLRRPNPPEPTLTLRRPFQFVSTGVLPWNGGKAGPSAACPAGW